MRRKFAQGEPLVNDYVRYERDDNPAAFSHPANMATDGQWFLKEWRKSRGLSQEALADLAGTSKGYVSDIESGKRPIPPGRLTERLAAALGVQPSDLFRDPETPEGEPMVRIIGQVGADNEGTVFYASADESGDMAPRPPGGNADSVALDVRGHSMRGFADDGALLYFEAQETPPTPDMLGDVVIVETEDGRVLVKRLLKGSRPGVYDLESFVGPTLPDVRLKWAANITAIIPRKMARRIARRRGEVG